MAAPPSPPTPGVVASVAYADGRRVGDVAIADISDVLKKPDVFVWVGLLDPAPELLEQIQQEFCLHDLAVEDARLAHQRPKLEQYGDSIFVVLRPAVWSEEEHRVVLGETHLFVGPQYVVCVRRCTSASYAPVRARGESTPGLLAKGPGFVLYAIMDFVVDHYFPVVDTLEAQLELKRAVSPLVDVCNRLMRFDLPLIPDDTRPYFRDVYDHAIRINEAVDRQRELLTGALEAHLSLIAVAQNDAMKKLAGWAAIIGVPTMVAGIYGMNFKFMPELEWHFGYPLVMTVIVAACGILYVRFRRAGWL